MTSVNTTSAEGWPSVTSNGMNLFLESDVSGKYAIYVATRTTLVAEFSAPALVATINTAGSDNAQPFILPDESGIYYVSNIGGGSYDIWRASPKHRRRVRDADCALDAQHALRRVRSHAQRGDLVLYFGSARSDSPAKGGMDIWMTKRASTTASFNPPTNIQELNTANYEWPDWFSANRCRLYFTRTNGGVTAGQSPSTSRREPDAARSPSGGSAGDGARDPLSSGPCFGRRCSCRCRWLWPSRSSRARVPPRRPSRRSPTGRRPSTARCWFREGPPPAKAPSAAKAPPQAKAPPPVLASRSAPASAGPRAKSKSEGPSVNGKVAVFGFTGEGAARVQQVVVSTLRTRGLQVTTTLRPVDSAEQYREMAATLQLAAYIDGAVGGAGPRGQATVHLRSGVTGRRIASVRFSGDRSALADDVGSGLWPRTGSQLTRLCAAAAKPRKGGRRALRIDAGTPLEASAPDDHIPAHLRNEPPTGRRKDNPWADEGT